MGVLGLETGVLRLERDLNMAKKKSNNKKNASDTNHKNNNVTTTGGGGDGIMVDPARVRFQHARIRPFFSGCGRGVEDTLDEIRQGKTQPSDLPPIQVLLGPIDQETGLHWYFSLNNRRLWVLKRCREEGLLPNNQIYARLRRPKSEQEANRYTVENCALEAKIISEKPRGAAGGGVAKAGSSTKKEKEEETNMSSRGANSVVDHLSQTAEKQLSIARGAEVDVNDDDEDSSEDDSECSDDEERPRRPSNQFSALF